MNSKWNSDTPCIKNKFNRKDSIASKDKEQTKPVTRNELKRLEAERSRPVAERSFTPDGETRQSINSMIDRQREARIKHIRTRLRRVNNRARNDFDRSR